MRKLILQSFQSPGDVLMLTATVRDLHKAHPRAFRTDVRTACDALWENNPYLTPLNPKDDDVELIRMNYPLVHSSNQRPYHFIHGYVQFLEQCLNVRIPLTSFRGDIHISDLEKSWMSQVEEAGIRGNFWIIMAGGKHDFTAKWWNPDSYQKVVDHFQGRILFVQCGEAEHWHPPLQNVLNFVGKTDLRQFVRLMYHADGVVCPVTFAMHLAAAVETKPGKPLNRAGVVIAGGREPPHWEAYPHHQFISTNGALMCCDAGGCWRSRCQKVGDGDDKDSKELCELPVAIRPDLQIPQCMNMITPDDVIRRIEMYFEGGALQYNHDPPLGQPCHCETDQFHAVPHHAHTGTLAELRPAIHEARRVGKRIVLAFATDHGLDPHRRRDFLAAARRYGDVLIVTSEFNHPAPHTDPSAILPKGIGEANGWRSTDFLLVPSQHSLRRVFEQLRPHVLVKDDNEPLDGETILQSYGGSVLVVDQSEPDGNPNPTDRPLAN